MSLKRILIIILAATAIMTMVNACGKSSSSTAAPVYKVVYVPGTGMNAPKQGKTAFQLVITKTGDASPAAGLAPTLSFLMTMGNGDQHATPADLVSESTATPGTYNCTAYYLMGGTWAMTVTVGGETTTFNPNVAMAMPGDDTISQKLFGADDIVTDMSSTSYNKYYIFGDGPVSASTPTLKLYISHGENMMMDFKAVSVGSVLSSGTVTSLVVSASTDSTFASGVATGVDLGHGHWSLSGLTGLVSSQTATVYVKLNVNTQDKTTDGNPMSGMNDYATFLVTPDM